MKKLKYFKFEYYPSELASGKSESGFAFGKLYSKYTAADPNDKIRIGNRLFSPEKNDFYSAHQRLPKENISFYDFKLSENTEPDDFMTSPEINDTFGFFISHRCKELLDKFELPAHRYYEVKIIGNEKSFEYYFLLISRENLKIDYANSTFVDRFNQEQIISIESYQDTLKLNPANENVRAHYTTKWIAEKSIIFTEAFDIFPALTTARAFFYFSERLKATLDKEEMTGYLLHEIESPSFFEL